MTILKTLIFSLFISINSLAVANTDFELPKDVINAIQQYSKSTVLVSAPVSIGSGVFISPQHILTAYHVVKNKKHIIIQPHKLNRAFAVKIIKYDATLDLAILETFGYRHPYFSRISQRPTQPYQRVINFGHPASSLNVVTTFGFYQYIASPKCTLVTASAFFGNSGGPTTVYNIETKKLLLIGIVSGVHSSADFKHLYPKLVCTVPTKTILEFINKEQ